MIANTLQKAMARRGHEAGIEGSASVYRFRSTMESGLRQRGRSGEAVGHMLGHSKQVGVEFYAYDMETLPEMQKAVSSVYTSA